MSEANEWVPLSSVLSAIVDNRGKSVPTVESGFPLIATNCIKENRIYPTFENIRYVSEETLNSWFRAHLEPNDILFVNKGTPGRVCLVPDPVSFCAAQDMIGFRVDSSKIDYRYLFAFLRSDWVKQTIANNHVGLVIPHFRKQDLDTLSVPMPSRSEQVKIGELYLQLSEKIEINHRINVELEGMAKLLYDYWFVQYDFPLSAAQAAALGQPHLTGQPYRSSGGPMVFDPQLKREIPKGWKVGSLTHLGEIVGGSTPSTKEIAFFTDHGTPWITPKDLSRNVGNKFITRGQTDLTESGVKSASLAVLPPGSVLMSSRAPIGYTAINRIPVTTNQGFKSFVPSKGYPVEFVYHTLNHLMGVIEQNASGSTFKEISTGALKAIHNVLPDADIIASYQAVVAPMFQQQDTLEQQNQELTTLRDWLLPMLMNGQVRVG